MYGANIISMGLRVVRCSLIPLGMRNGFTLASLSPFIAWKKRGIRKRNKKKRRKNKKKNEKKNEKKNKKKKKDEDQCTRIIIENVFRNTYWRRVDTESRD